MLIDLPEGVEMDLKLYVTSDKAGVDICYRVGGFNKMADRFLEKVELKNVQFPDIADDWRIMTRAEIVEYKRKEAEDERELSVA